MTDEPEQAREPEDLTRLFVKRANDVLLAEVIWVLARPSSLWFQSTPPCSLRPNVSARDRYPNRRATYSRPPI